MKDKDLIFITITLTLLIIPNEGNYSNVDLPENHLKYYFNSFPAEAEKCQDDVACPYKVEKLLQNFLHSSKKKHFFTLQNIALVII